MGMQSQLVLGGVVLLILALTLKAMVGRTPLKRGPVAFAVLWASLAACHFWRLGETLVQMAPGDLESGWLAALAGFWLIFALALLPGVFMIHSWMRSWEPFLPRWFERTVGIVSPIVAVVLLFGHVFMSAHLAIPQMGDLAAADSLPGRIVRQASRLSLNTYLQVATRVCGMSAAHLRQDRVPTPIIEALLRRSPAPGPNQKPRS